ncbi:hypothetical protein [Nocardia sp. NPDC056000]|uniref:hypothetical protein n=1 Tax=Nocardia sp. NPDC056000 TaxID=3345674 RepID=UPI0035E35BA5
MNSKRTSLALSVLPIMLVAGQGVAAAAPGQPGLAVPGEGQPGLSTTPQSPPAATAPSPADWIPDPPIAPPNRPRPQQQTQPDVNTLVNPKPQATQPDTVEPEAVQPQTPNQEVMPTDPHKLRVGTSTVQLPDYIDTKSRDKAQAYLDMAEWQVAAVYDGLGFPRDQSDRMAAGSISGSVVGAGIGMVSTGLFVVGGCGVGGVIGGIAGAVIGGVPTGGVGAPIGAGIGGSVGCLVGALGAGLPGMVVGAVLGAVGGGVLGGLTGGTPDTKPADPPALIDQPFVAPVSAPVAPVAPIVPAVAPIPAAQPVYDAVAPVAQQVETVVNQVGTQVAQTVDQVTQTVETTVDSLRSAVAQMPPLTPESFLAGLAPAPGA